jgi:hypothetical protein
MTKQAGLLIFVFLLPFAVLRAQLRTAPSDHFMMQVGYNNWINKPDSVNTKTLGYVFNLYVCYNFPIKKTRLSFAAGIGLNNQVVYLKNQMLVRNDTGILGTAAHIYDDSNGDYKRYKVNTVYLQAPFELRYYGNLKNHDKGFKAALGVQVGALLGAHTKGITSVGGSLFKEKVSGRKFLSPWNFAATARVGYGHLSIFGSYNITNVFRDTNGPELTPFSMGICISGL